MHNTSHGPKETGGCPGIDFWQGEGHLQGPANNSEYFPQYSTEIFAKQHVNTILAHNTSEPLFIYAPFQNAHVPHQVPKRFFDMYHSENNGACPWEETHDGRMSFDCHPNARFPDSPCGQDCGCNRLLVAAMMSALDEAILNMTAALKAKGMWDDTVMVVMGDNGGPLNNGHDNGPFRGGKLNWWEGGVRPFAFLASPLLPAGSLRGGWYNNSIHETDWFATFAALASAPLPKTYEVDGLDVWPSLLGQHGAHRTEVLISDNILRMGKYKLIMGGGFNQTQGEAWRQGMLRDCMLGTGGGLHAAAPIGMSKTSMCPDSPYKSTASAEMGDQEAEDGKLDCTTVDAWGDKEDKWLCSAPCNATHPCLFDVESDLGERHDLASQMPDMVAHIKARLLVLQQGFWSAPMLQDNGKFCAQMEANGGFYGPWLD